MALLFGGSKAFPARKALISFARQCCQLTEKRAVRLLDWVIHGLDATLSELQTYQAAHPDFEQVGQQMQAIWRQGIEELRT